MIRKIKKRADQKEGGNIIWPMISKDGQQKMT